MAARIMTWSRSSVLIAVVVLAASAGYPGADLVALDSGIRQAPSSGASAPAAPGLPWLHVAHPAGGAPFVADPQGRQVILRGAVAAGLVDWWSGVDPTTLAPPPAFPIDPAAYASGRCPANTDRVRVPPLCANDFPEMASLGFNLVRLGVSWSLLEPAPGQYSQVYLARIAQVVDWAAASGIYVMLDMHQDAYSRYLARPVPAPLPNGSPPSLSDHDGAPAWATITDGLPSERFIGQREVNPAVGAAFTNFWFNRWVAGPQGAAPGRGLEDHYIGAIAFLARRFRDDSAVAGYNVFNEPWPGFVTPPLFEDLFLLPFYRRVIDAITGTGDGLPCPASWPGLAACGYPDLGIRDRNHLVFLEADHLRSQLDFQTDVPLPVSSYANLVYGIHAYTHKFTIDALLGQPADRATYPWGGFDQSYADAEREAISIGAALVVTEFGNEPAADGMLLANQLREQELHHTGATYWPWKENCDFGPPWGIYAGVFGESSDQRCAYDHGVSRGADTPQSGCLRLGKERLLARVWPAAIAARSFGYAFDSNSGAFHLAADSAAGPETLVVVPPEVTGAVSVGGAAALREVEPRATGGRVLHVAPTGGRYTIDVVPAPLALAGC
jgi:endoglycosylceramidase